MYLSEASHNNIVSLLTNPTREDLRANQKRGGWAQYIEDMRIKAYCYHFVTDANNKPLTKSSSGDVNNLAAMFSAIAVSSWNAMFRGVPLGEVCVRLIYYSAQPKKDQEPHEDPCLLTVPLFDSLYTLGEPFISVLGNHVRPGLLYTPRPHIFRTDEQRPRLYGVAFCQPDLDMPSILTGEPIREVINALCDTKLSYS